MYLWAVWPSTDNVKPCYGAISEFCTNYGSKCSWKKLPFRLLWNSFINLRKKSEKILEVKSVPYTLSCLRLSGNVKSLPKGSWLTMGMDQAPVLFKNLFSEGCQVLLSMLNAWTAAGVHPLKVCLRRRWACKFIACPRNEPNLSTK